MSFGFSKDEDEDSKIDNEKDSDFQSIDTKKLRNKYDVQSIQDDPIYK